MVKRVEDGEGTIIRLAETTGQDIMAPITVPIRASGLATIRCILKRQTTFAFDQ